LAGNTVVRGGWLREQLFRIESMAAQAIFAASLEPGVEAAA